MGAKRTEAGKTRIALAKALGEAGYDVDPSDLFPQRGAWRTNRRLDVCRWEATVRRRSDGLHLAVLCWDTMTECVRRGILVERDQRQSSFLNVWAKPVNAGAVPGV